MSQATSTFWDERIEKAAAYEKVNPIAKRRVRAQRLIDAIILTIILAAAATCFSVYSRARVELGAVLIKHETAGERVKDLTIRVQKLEHDVQQLRTDSRVIELFARQRFGFVRSGEVVIKLAQEPSAAAANTMAERRVNLANSRGANLTSRSSEGYTDASN